MGHPWSTWGQDLRRDAMKNFQNYIFSLFWVHMTSLHHWFLSHPQKFLKTLPPDVIRFMLVGAAVYAKSTSLSVQMTIAKCCPLPIFPNPVTLKMEDCPIYNARIIHFPLHFGGSLICADVYALIVFNTGFNTYIIRAVCICVIV